jgi:phosphohistidine phosphatase
MSTSERTLLLLRHAKSGYPDGVVDHDRPLAPRGEREAGLAGDWIRANAPAVDAVLCSTATRTRQTLARTGIEAPTQFLDQLYDSSPGITLDVISRVDELFGATVGTLLVVGHEPTTSQLALGLADGGDEDAFERMSLKYPTSSIAVLRTAEPWQRLAPRSATLVAFHVPR